MNIFRGARILFVGHSCLQSDGSLKQKHDTCGKRVTDHALLATIYSDRRLLPVLVANDTLAWS